MDALIKLDTINCRAKHSEWLSATRPAFYDRSQDQGSISISGVFAYLKPSTKCIDVACTVFLKAKN